MDFELLQRELPLPDNAAKAAAQAHWNRIAKPVGSLGSLETLVVGMAGMTGGDLDIGKRAVLVFCADNGVVAEGVASTPAEITAVMAEFIAQKKSSVCIMARAARTDVIPVDMGMLRPVPGLLECRIAAGTGNIAAGPAMTRRQAQQAIQTGMDLVADCRGRGYKILATGEMGIGNTTTSSAVAAVLLDIPPADLTGRGAGLSDEGFSRKIRAIERAVAVNRPDSRDALDVLAKLGGFDIAAMCGVFLGGAKYRVPVIIDGVISAVSALVAARLCPHARYYMLASHLSAEPAAGRILAELGLEPLIHANLRLGEGTGAVAVLPLLDMALSVYHDLMTFADIGM